MHNGSSTKFHYNQTIIKTRSSTMWPKQVAHKKDVAWPQTVFHRQTKYQCHQHDNKKKQRYKLQKWNIWEVQQHLVTKFHLQNHQLQSKQTLY